MNIEELRDYSLSLNGVTESFPFGEDTLVFKTNDKIFLLASLSSAPLQFNVKCNSGICDRIAGAISAEHTAGISHE